MITFGFELQMLPVTAPGVEQKATWLQVRQSRPDYVLLRGWGVMNSTALKEAQGKDVPECCQKDEVAVIEAQPEAPEAEAEVPPRAPSPEPTLWERCSMIAGMICAASAVLLQRKRPA